MSEIKLDAKKLNKEIAADLPEVPRDENGKIDIEKIKLGISKRNNIIVPDDIFDSYYKELPDKVENKTGSWRTSNGGKIRIFGGDPEADKEIHKAGANASNTAQAHRRTCKEILEQLTNKSANIDEIERLGLEEGTSNLEAASYAAMLKAIRGDIKALEYIRDTLGEKPTDKIDASVTSLTLEDKAMLENISKRLKGDLE